MSKLKIWKETPIRSDNIRNIKSGFGWIDHNLKLLLDQLPQEAQLIYYTLCLYADRSGLCSLSQRELREITRLGFTTLIKYRNKLIEKELIAYDYRDRVSKFQVLSVPIKTRIISTTNISPGRKIVLDFYKNLGKKEPVKRIEKGVEIYNELIQEGYSNEVIEKTIDWAIKNIPNVHSFGIIREVIGEVSEKEKKKEDVVMSREKSLNKYKEETRKNKESRVLDESLEQIFNSLEEGKKENIKQRVRFEVDKLKVKPEFEGPILRSTRLKILRDEFLSKEIKT